MKKHRISRRAIALAAVAVLGLAGCGGGGDGGDDTPPWAFVTTLGGDTTNFTGNQSSSGFDTPAANLDGAPLDLKKRNR